MKYKHKRICKSIVSLLLIITFILAPFEDVFAGKLNEASTNETGAGGQLSDGNGDGIKPLKNLAVTIGILEIDNTGVKSLPFRIQTLQSMRQKSEYI